MISTIVSNLKIIKLLILFYRWLLKDAIELSRGRTNRLIKTLEQFDSNDLDVQALRRGQTFKTISPLKRLQLGELGEKSQSSTVLTCETEKDELQNQNHPEKTNNLMDGHKNNSTENQSVFRLSMMNELDSD